MNKVLNKLNKIIYHFEENKNYKEANDLQKIFIKLSQIQINNKNSWFDKMNIFKKNPKKYLIDEKLIEDFQRDYPELLQNILDAMGPGNYKIVDTDQYDDYGNQKK